MKNLILSELIVLRKDKKSQLLSLILLFSVIAFSFSVSAFDLGNLAQGKQEDVYNIQGSMDTVSEVDRVQDSPL